MDSEAKSTFTVSIEGIDLPEETVARINDALQRAALTEIASVDLRGNDLVFRPIMRQMVADQASLIGGGGSTGGAQIQITQRS